MHSYLEQHPDIHMLPKELHYWGSDLKYQNPRLPKAEYEDHLNEALEGKVIGEAAVWYLTSQNAAAELKEFTPDAKIIIMLRNPVSAAYSLHSQMVYTGNEPLEDASDALEIEADRMNGNQLPEHYYCPQQGLYYREVYKYKAQIARYVELFGKENIHFIFFEDLKHDVAQSYKNTLEFIGVDESFAPDFEIVNANKTTRNKGIQKLILSPGKSVKGVVKTLLPSKRIRERIKGKLWDANSKETQRKPMGEMLKNQLLKEFADEIKYLEELKANAS